MRNDNKQPAVFSFIILLFVIKHTGTMTYICRVFVVLICFIIHHHHPQHHVALCLGWPCLLVGHLTGQVREQPPLSQPTRQTQHYCITFIQRRTNEVGPTLYKSYTNVLCLLGTACSNSGKNSAALQHQYTVSAYLSSKQIPSFGFARQNACQQVCFGRRWLPS